MSAVRKLQPALRRVVVIRQATGDRWSVEAYECAGGRWRFTWLMHPPTARKAAERHGRTLARAMGLPFGEQPRGGAVGLLAGTLGAWS